jgi:DNA-binding MarR family transcriptional regulator
VNEVGETQLDELRHVLRHVLRGLWRRRRPPEELLELVASEPPLGPRHLAVLAHVAAEEDRTVSEIANDLGLSLPAASKLTRDLADHRLLRRREDPDDRRRTVVDLDEETALEVRAWLSSRNQPLERALSALDESERAAFLKGLHALADALMEESSCGSVRSHHRAAHRRRSHRHRPL